MRLIERALNWLVWVIHGYIWAIQNNPLTEAWKKFEIDNPHFGVLRDTSCKAIICDDSHRPDLASKLTALQKEKAEWEARTTKEVLKAYKDIEKIKIMEDSNARWYNNGDYLPVDSIDNITGFKEHVRREKIIKQHINPISYRFYTSYAPVCIDRSLQGQIFACEEDENKHWSQALGGVMGAFL